MIDVYKRQLLLHRLVQLEGLNSGLVGRHFLLLVLFSQLVADYLHLLPEIVIPLAPVDLQMCIRDRILLFMQDGARHLRSFESPYARLGQAEPVKCMAKI